MEYFNWTVVDIFGNKFSERDNKVRFEDVSKEDMSSIDFYNKDTFVSFDLDTNEISLNGKDVCFGLFINGKYISVNSLFESYNIYQFKEAHIDLDLSGKPIEGSQNISSYNIGCRGNSNEIYPFKSYDVGFKFFPANDIGFMCVSLSSESECSATSVISIEGINLGVANIVSCRDNNFNTYINTPFFLSEVD